MYKAVAGSELHYYYAVRVVRGQSIPQGVAGDGRQVRLVGIAQFGGFDGPFVALFPQPVHSPRHDAVYHRKRGQIQLRRWHRRAGFGPVPDPRRRAPGAPQSRTGAGRSLHGRHVRHRERLDGGCAGDPDGPARNSAALGQAAMGAALSGQACQAVQSAPPVQKQRRPSLRPRRPALFALSRCRQAIQLRLFRDPRDDAGRRTACQETASRRQTPASTPATACSTSVPAGAALACTWPR